MGRTRFFTLLAGVMVLAGFVLVFESCVGPINPDGVPTEDRGPSDEPAGDGIKRVSQPENGTSQPSGDIPEYFQLLGNIPIKAGDEARAKEEEIEITINSVAFRETCRLVNCSYLPFSTHVPSGFAVLDIEGYSRKITGIPPGVTGFRGLLIGLPVSSGEWKWDPRLDVVFFDKGTGESEALSAFQEIVNACGRVEESKKDWLPSWTLSSYILTGEQDGLTGVAALGRYEDRYFYIFSRWSSSWKDEWAAIEGSIYSQWRWKGKCSVPPRKKAITTFPEGYETLSDYVLVDHLSLPFFTYIPEGLKCDISPTEQADVLRIDLGYGHVEVVFFKEETGHEAAKKAFLEAVDQQLGKDKARDDSLPWALSSFSRIDPKRGRVSRAALAAYGYRYFYILSDVSLEAGDAWGEIQNLFYGEWRWKEGCKTFEEGLTREEGSG